MTKHCLNCNHPVKEKYCPQCGQPTDVARVTWKSFSSELLHGLTHAEESFAGTTWQLLKQPGKVLNEYLDGKHKKYQSPVGFFLLWVTLSILTHRMVLARSGFHPVYLEGLTFSNPESIKAFITHGEFFYLVCFPLSSAVFYFLIAKPFYSYMEAIIINMYCFALSSAAYTFCYLIGGLILSLNVLHWKFYLFQIILSQIITFWACLSLFRPRGLKLVVLRILFYMAVNLIVTLKFLELLSDLWVRIEEHFQF